MTMLTDDQLDRYHTCVRKTVQWARDNLDRLTLDINRLSGQPDTRCRLQCNAGKNILAA